MVRIERGGRGEVRLALLEPSDGEPLRRFFFRLSAETLYRRFMSPVSRLEQVRADRLLDIDHCDREAVVAVEDGEIVGVARYVRRHAAQEAELAVVVADDWQRQGHASRMLEVLAQRAAAACIERFTMSMLADNRPILRLVRRADPTAKFALSYGVYETTLPVRAFRMSTTAQVLNPSPAAETQPCCGTAGR